MTMIMGMRKTWLKSLLKKSMVLLKFLSAWSVMSFLKSYFSEYVKAYCLDRLHSIFSYQNFFDSFFWKDKGHVGGLFIDRKTLLKLSLSFHLHVTLCRSITENTHKNWLYYDFPNVICHILHVFNSCWTISLSAWHNCPCCHVSARGG